MGDKTLWLKFFPARDALRVTGTKDRAGTKASATWKKERRMEEGEKKGREERIGPAAKQGGQK
jgi:hypothetical protein